MLNAPAPHDGPAGFPPQARPQAAWAGIRDRFHRVADLLACYASPEAVAVACRMAPAHVRTLARSPAMLELVAAKRAQQEAA